MRAIALMAALSLCVATLGVEASEDAGSMRQQIDIPAQDLDSALRALEKDRQLQVVFLAEDVARLKTQGVSGAVTVQEALAALLEETGLKFEFLNEKTVSVMPVAVNTGAVDGVRRFDIKEQPLAQALVAFEAQSGLDVDASSALTVGKKAASLRGEMSTADALTRLLKGSGLTFAIGEDGVIAVQTAHSAIPAVASAALAQAEGVEPVQPNDGESSSNSNLTAERPLQEIVVTGTNLRGAYNPTSPLVQYGAEEIARLGYFSADQFVQSLPQNFGAGSSSLAVGGLSAGNGSNVNVNSGTGANLRGLGNSGTLVLFNGHRIAPAGVGNFVDLSMIPLGLVDRVDVLTDGASAIYGSDAVGGVINFVLRRRYDGANTRIRYGSVTEGSYAEYQVTQSFGRAWITGSALLGYDYSENAELDSADRAFTEDAPDPTDLIGRNRRHGLVASLSQQAGPGIELLADGVYSRRDTDIENNAGFYNTADLSVEQYAVNAGARVDLNSNWLLATNLNYGLSQTENISAFPDFFIVDESEYETTTVAFDAVFDGTLFRAPGGDAQLAFGGHIRHETFDATGAVTPPQKLERDVSAVFAEMRVPLAGPDGARPGVEALELSIAARYEDYSDFGSVTRPKLGLLWSPADGINFRASYGMSFRAPYLFELEDSLLSSAASLDIRDPADPASSVVSVIILSGNNSNLRPEEATTWTFGFDMAPASIPGLQLSATYFNIDFEDQIATGFPGGVFEALVDSRVASLVNASPDLAAVADIFARPDFFPLSSATPADIVAIVDNRLNNISSTRESGLDFSVDYKTDVGANRYSAQLNATYFLDVENRATDGAPPTSVLNQRFYPVDWRTRAGLGWGRGGTDAFLFLNYTAGYDDPTQVPATSIDDWLTADVTLTHQVAEQSPLAGVRIGLSVRNITDEDPPFAGNIYNLNFDPINASPLGRFVSLTLEKHW